MTDTANPVQDVAQNDSASLTPTEQAVQSNPSAIQMPQAVTAPQPSPAPTPNAQAGPKVLPRRGLMASVLMGALRGADEIMTHTGKAIEAAGKNSGIGQNIQNQRLARQQTQQKMDIEKQKAQEESVKATDEHTKTLLQINNSFLDNAHKAAENAHIE